MGAEEHDIIARVSGAGATPDGKSASTGALAAHLAHACGHVCVSERVVALGYRFHPPIGDDIPAFFNRIVRTGATVIALTLQGGIDLRDDSDAFDGCRNTKDAAERLRDIDHHASLWKASVMVGVHSMDIWDIAKPLFIAKHPSEFRLIAEELIAVGVLTPGACPMCSELDEDDFAHAYEDLD